MLLQISYLGVFILLLELAIRWSKYKVPPHKKKKIFLFYERHILLKIFINDNVYHMYTCYFQCKEVNSVTTEYFNITKHEE